MSPRWRSIVGLVLLFAVAPLTVLLWPAAEPVETVQSCSFGAMMPAGSFDLDISRFIAGGVVALVAIGFVISGFIGRDRASTIVAELPRATVR